MKRYDWAKRKSHVELRRKFNAWNSTAHAVIYKQEMAISDSAWACDVDV